jgi:hypothetical protein
MIEVITSAAVSKAAEETLARGLGTAISLIPGKQESHLMLRISGENAMYFKGETGFPMAYVRVGVAGHAEESFYRTFGQAVLDLLAETIGVPQKNVYLTVQEIPTWVVRKE